MTQAFAFDMHAVPATVMERGEVRRTAEASHSADWADIARGTTHTLPEGMRLGDYEIVAPIGEGGFGIVYLAWDHELQQHVAIKEYLPAVLASRANVSSAVIVKSQRHMHSFNAGMRSFVNEARMLARFDHPSLVRVLHFWECNGTAYMAMPYYVGPTLARALAELGRAPDEAEILSWLNPLIDALETMHGANCFHRDIAPDNILLTDHGPVLLDFGAARRVIEGTGPAPTAVFKPGYAPIEQYGEGASMKQGPWTDLYALASVVYTAITGKPPTPSVERLMGDELRPLADLARERYSASFLLAIDNALSLHPRNRPHSMAEFRAKIAAQPPMSLQDIDVDALFAEVPDVLPRQAEPCAPCAEASSERIEPSPFVVSAGAVAVSSPDVLATRLLALRMHSATIGRQGRFRGAALWGVAAFVGITVAGFYREGQTVRTAAPPHVFSVDRTQAVGQATAGASASVAQAKAIAAESLSPAARSGAVLLDRESVRPHAAALAESLPESDEIPVGPQLAVAASDPVPAGPAASAPQAVGPKALPEPFLAVLAGDAKSVVHASSDHGRASRREVRRSPVPPAPVAQAASTALDTPAVRPVSAVSAVSAMQVVPAMQPEPPARMTVAALQEPAGSMEASPPSSLQLAEPARHDVRCTDILLRASLGPLKADDTAFLKKGCE